VFACVRNATAAASAISLVSLRALQSLPLKIPSPLCPPSKKRNTPFSFSLVRPSVRLETFDRLSCLLKHQRVHPTDQCLPLRCWCYCSRPRIDSLLRRSYSTTALITRPALPHLPDERNWGCIEDCLAAVCQRIVFLAHFTLHIFFLISLRWLSIARGHWAIRLPLLSPKSASCSTGSLERKKDNNHGRSYGCPRPSGHLLST